MDNYSDEIKIDNTISEYFDAFNLRRQYTQAKDDTIDTQEIIEESYKDTVERMSNGNLDKIDYDIDDLKVLIKLNLVQNKHNKRKRAF